MQNKDDIRESVLKLTNFMKLGVGDSYVISKVDCANLLNHMQLLEMNLMYSEVLKYNIEIGNPDLLDYCNKLNDGDFLVSEFTNMINIKSNIKA